MTNNELNQWLNEMNYCKRVNYNPNDEYLFENFHEMDSAFFNHSLGDDEEFEIE